jgi:uncharacterized protein YheU (UPF0270 family)
VSVSKTDPDDGERAGEPAGEPVIVPYTELSVELLHAVVEAFVLREGTDYGEREVPLDQKVAGVLRQLARGDAQIVFDPDTETVGIIAGRPTRESIPRVRGVRPD